MSKGTFSRTVTIGFTIKTATGTFACEDISVDASGTWDYDPGCRYTANGDGWPPNLDFEATIDNRDEVLAAVREQLTEAGEPTTETDDEIMQTAYEVLEEKLAEDDVREWQPPEPDDDDRRDFRANPCNTGDHLED